MKMKKMLLTAMLFAFVVAISQAQTPITGVVYDAEVGEPIPGASVYFKGTTTGTITNLDGEFSLTHADDSKSLIVSFIGMQNQVINIGEQTNFSIYLISESTEMDEVVVTALGIKREKKALGYAAAEVDSEAFENVKDANVMNALSGRLAGVQINSTAQGPGSSSSVIIRGNSVLSGSNEPLYVVDGMPISNTQFSNADNSDHGGIDSGNGLSAIPADDIDNISVLKGPAATALYGSRAINGVVLITTKSGKGTEGTTIEFNSNFTLSNARIYSDWQNEYGQGTNGMAPQTPTEGKENTSMWGAKYSATDSYVDYKGDTGNYGFHDNESNFYDLGSTWTNSLALNHNTEKGQVRISYSNMTNKGMVPGTNYDRNSLSINGGSKALNNRLELNAKISYNNEKSNNALMGSSPFNPTSQLMSVPNNVPLSALKDYKDAETGLPIGIGMMNTNPYWTLNEIDHSMNKDRLMTLITARYNITDDLSAQIRGGSDMTFFNNESIYAVGTPYYESGKASMTKAKEIESNYDFLLTYDKDFTEKVGVTVNAGASRMDKKYDAVAIYSDNYPDPTMVRPGLGLNNSQEMGYHEKRINSVYGTAQFRYNNALYIDVSARNDWSSTLPTTNNSYFYPSVSTSLVVSEITEMPSWMSFAKVRGSIAQVGSDTDPYQLSLQYKIDENGHPVWTGGDGIVGGIDGNTIPNDNLKPSIMTSYELGADLRFMRNRLGLDITYYHAVADDQIMPVSVSGTSGYDKAIVNTGSIQNSGWEVTAYATLIDNSSFKWNTSFNFSKNNNEVVSLSDNVSQLNLISGGGVSVVAAVGQEYGTIMGTTYQRDENGDVRLDGNGLPMASNELSAIGCGVHDIMMGWVNSFSYQHFTFNLVLDSKFGGEVYSSTESAAYSTGKHTNTLARGGYESGGVWYPDELKGQGTTARPEDYYAAVSSVDEQFIYDASYISLKEISLNYRLPATLFDKSKHLSAASVGFFARDLGYLYRATKNIDPQSAYSISNGASGIEMGNMAMPATYGINLNVKF